MEKPVQKNFLGLKRIDHVHFYVRDLKKAIRRYVDGFNFRIVARATNRSIGLPDTVHCDSIVLNQNRITFVFTQPIGNDGEIAKHVNRHGDGVKDVAFLVEDAKVALEEAERRGARTVVPLQIDCDGQGTFKWGSIAAYGDVVHSFIERKNYRGFAPGYIAERDNRDWSSEISLLMIDHVVANVYSMKEWVGFYERVFGLVQTQHFDIRTPRSALMSMVMEDRDVYIKLPINEPFNEPGRGKSQIQEYLDDYKGPGVQHIAFLTNNIIPTVKEMRDRGVEFLLTPKTYYDDELAKRVGEIDEDIEKLKETSILVDREADDAYLLQIFANNHPFFEEIIQRKGNSYGFGHGNFRALFEAIEREQIKRGTLKDK